jgi:hypothetical protein
MSGQGHASPHSVIITYLEDVENGQRKKETRKKKDFNHNVRRRCQHLGSRSYHKKNGSQQMMKVPIMIPKVRAALCSRFILIKCLSLVGVCSDSMSCSARVFDEPDPLNASPFVPPVVVPPPVVVVFVPVPLPAPLECRCISMAVPWRRAICFSWRLASRKMAQYVNIMIVHGIQNDTELENTT